MSAPQPPSPPDPEPKFLTSWKEIASYLGVADRTAQKWERERGLPVHRVSRERGRVQADRAELDEWLTSHSIPIPLWQNPRFLFWYSIAITVLFLVACGFWAWSQRDFWSSREPNDFTIQGEFFVVYDEGGRELWRKKIPNLMLQLDRPWERWNFVKFEDLDGDGHLETLLVDLPLNRNEVGDTLYCLGRDGSTRWSYHVRQSVGFGDQVFGPVYHIRSFRTIDDPARKGQKYVAVASVNAAGQPSQQAFLDAGGNLAGEYWHLGHLENIVAGDTEAPGRPLVYASGYCLGAKRAEIVVLDPARLPQPRMPARKTEVASFMDIGGRGEHAIIRFGKTDLAERLHQTPMAAVLSANPGFLRVQVTERLGGYFPYITYELNAQYETIGFRGSGALNSEYSEMRASRFPDLPTVEQELARLGKEVEVVEGAALELAHDWSVGSHSPLETAPEKE